jgi:hypothetical protein
MANTTLTPSMIGKKALMVLMNQLTMAKAVNREYSSQFSNDGAKIGQSYSLRKPPRFLGRSGEALQVEGANEQFTTITLDQLDGCDFSFSTTDLTLSIDDFADRFLVPALATVANKIDFALTALYKDVFRIVNAGASAVSYGTAGTLNGGSATLAQVQGQILTAGAILTETGVPTPQRAVVLDPMSQVSVISPMTALFNPSTKISAIFEDAALATDTLGFDWAANANIQQFTPMAAGSLTAISSAPASGATTLAVTTTAGTIPRGTVCSLSTLKTVKALVEQCSLLLRLILL